MCLNHKWLMDAICLISSHIEENAAQPNLAFGDKISL